ncbi:endoplasmic reticulum protein [Coprinopsis cinerea okayama7|uniref:Endoplasmic reticulum protein n=1 Tax=Coprinopsis cinerea (strain Okayama-7 / 130 / ATCC MYA-4618 / FGSC 9003) TaxID=240176 RepID=A8N0T0_COPC7|nr:endoplasmic reticulum protein [Coprinopsis cinerea okayama7\|eukprot:XP_001828481.1 endoplasmic reticulum protein [Coprinopsis cinerea okayama7\
MFRTAVARVARTIPQRSARAVIVPATRPAFAYVTRFNSSQAPSKPPKTPEQLARKEAFEKQDDLQRDWDAKVLTYNELLPKTQSPTPATFLIDVREPDEVAQGMIPSAVNIPLSVLSNSLALNPAAFKEKFGFDKPKPTQEVIFYCRSGKRSTTACDVAKRNGYENILNYKGSWLEWTEQQNPKPTSA